jgi:hypothetical protein
MAMRIRTKFRSGQNKTIEDRAGVVGFNLWRAAHEACRRMEKENFPLGDNLQMLAVIAEMVAFLLQVTDRLVYGKLPEEERQRFINALGVHLAKTMQSNVADVLEGSQHQARFIETLNERLATYAEFDFPGHAPSYAFIRYLADRVSAAMAATDNKWVLEHVMEIEVPEMMKVVRRVVGEVLGINTAAMSV